MLRWLMTSADSPKAGAYSLCGSSSTMWAAGCFCRMARRISAVVQDLPVPVVPTIAKCLPSRSSTRTLAEIVGSCRRQPTRTVLRRSPQKACSSSSREATRTRSPRDGYAETPRLKEAARPLAAFHSSPTRPSSAIHSSLSPSRWAGTGTLSAETMASTTVLAVSIANSVPISGRSATARGRLSRPTRPLSSSTMALAPVIETMRPIDRSGWGSRWGTTADMVTGSLVST